MGGTLVLLLTVLSYPLLTASAQASDGEPIEVIVVTGRQPGPPLWRVSNGERQLYIFGSFSPVPKDIIWDSQRVAQILANSQEVILEPDVDADFSTGVLLNPINLFRGRRLAKRLTRNPDGASLEEVLPAALYARYVALKQRHFPNERVGGSSNKERPFVAVTRLAERIQRQQGLADNARATKPLRKLIRRNRHLKETRVEAVLSLKGSFSSLARRAEQMMQSLSPTQELACFEYQLGRMESELDAMKSRANAWAQGYVDAFRRSPLRGDENDPCLALVRQSSELGTLEELRTELDQRWLAAAEQALATNDSTLAILDIVDLTRDDGPLSQLAARGYEIWEP